ncbi:MAG: ComF family protein [Phycisphaeraceae bacterium]|nr:ComF family protein [Phycisphaerales bacterium]MCB9860710.1 ComF family protein [Phycisphaeraceae bacterium]
MKTQQKTPRHSAEVKRIISCVRVIESTWLGYAAAPLGMRMENAGWHPDEPDAWCPTCGRNVGPHEVVLDQDDEQGLLGRASCSFCRTNPVPWDGCVRLGQYKDELREVIHDMKFTRWHALARRLGRMLGETLADRLNAEGIPTDHALLVPIPTTFSKRMARGIDHTMQLTHGVSAQTGVQICRLLQRDHRPSQVGLSRTKRAINVKGSMKARTSIPSGCRALVVVDDVMTTGATCSEAVRALRAAMRMQDLRFPVLVAVAGVADDI